ncbi:MAG: beta-galactosidase [Planctomycetota bacterium]|nr:beta-galactosidase [Planctomycetota bacterium]
MREIELSEGWQILQEVHDNGETIGLHTPDFKATIGNAVSEWEPLPRLAHLQTVLARQPYFGRELRYFNEHAWWYRLDFECPAGDAAVLRLRFEGVDYFAKVWLNGELLGEHEGYYEPFEFGIESVVRRGGKNALVVKVSSPWDTKVLPGREAQHTGEVVRNLIKGTYEHSDTFVQRDVNPVGIWQPVKLLLSDCCYPAGRPCVTSALSADRSRADLAVSWTVGSAREVGNAELVVRIEDQATGLTVVRAAKPLALAKGENRLDAALALASPRLWSTWDRGGPALYRAHLELRAGGKALLVGASTFGIRTVALQRTPKETSFWLNGEKLFIRGTTYFPDTYVSQMNRARYERDVRAMIAAGANAVRIHVHAEKQEFYEICDRLGILVVQDNELNWHFPTDAAFCRRAERAFAGTIEELKPHPCIAAWICINEAPLKDPAVIRMGEALEQLSQRLDPTRPTIRNTWDAADLASGDSHDYAGSLSRGSYTDVRGKKYKLLSEFGADAPACEANLRQVPELARKLAKLLPQIPFLHDYQYRLLKYQIEHLRMQKYAPCSGFFQFMWIDLCPQSFYGVYDYWGCPKVGEQGGGLRAFLESSAPLGVFMEHFEEPVALWAVNDLARSFSGCRVEWTATSESGAEVARGSKVLDIPADCRVRVADLSFPVKREERYRVCLTLAGPDGAILASNRYDDPFHHLSRLPGYPERMDHETGMRLWNA